MNTWQPPNVYPYVDTNPNARCRLWSHGKAVVRTVNIDGRLVERYDCLCGKFYWLSQEDGRRPIVRFRVVRR